MKMRHDLMWLLDITPTEILEDDTKQITITAQPHPRAEFWGRMENPRSGIAGDLSGYMTIIVKFRNGKSFAWDPWASTRE